MNNTRKILALSVTLALTLPTLAQAEGFYISGQIGVSEQATDSQPIGNNIAVDSDFPAEFDSGDGTLTSVGIGYIINQQFRVEGRIANRDGSFNDTRFGTGARDGEEYILNG